MTGPRSAARRSRSTGRAPRLRLPALAVIGALVGCGGEPPEEIQGFRLGMSQADVMAEANRRSGFSCRLRGSEPRLTTCAGPSGQGAVEAVVVGDSTVRVTLELAPDPEAEEGARRFVRGFGDPAWRDRPYPPRDPSAFHTFWVDRDTTRGLALVCEGEDLEEPCRVRLEATTPAAVVAKLDTLLGIRR